MQLLHYEIVLETVKWAYDIRIQLTRRCRHFRLCLHLFRICHSLTLFLLT